MSDQVDVLEKSAQLQQTKLKAQLYAQRALLAGIADDIRKAKGKDAIALYNSEHSYDPIEVTPTGIYSLDRALGVGGWPKGRVIELFGSEGACKSSIALTAIVSAQREGALCAYIDAENALSEDFMEKLGVDLSRLLISQLNMTEDIFDMINLLIDSKIRIIVLDSIASMCPKAELNGDFGDWTIGLNARLIGQAMRKLVEKIKSTQSVVIFINQVRENVGVMFGNPETTPGGRAIKFAASVRLKTTQASMIKENNETVGINVRMYVAKNKVAWPFKTVEAPFYFSNGFNNEIGIFDDAVKAKLLDVRGAYYSYKDFRMMKKDWRTFLKERPDVLKQMIDDLDAVNGIVKTETPTAEDIADNETELTTDLVVEEGEE